MEYVYSLADMNNTSMSTVMRASYSNLINTGLTEATPADYSVVKKHKLVAAISPYRIYLLCDEVLYSINADGSDQFKIASKCYNPGELSFSVTDSNTIELRTLWYFEGYVYFITYGTTSKLCRFEVGGSGISEICKNKVSAFTISEDGVLYGYSDTDNTGKRELTFEKDLTK
jgi:hypothetical protein